MVSKTIKLTNDTKLYRAKANYTNLNGVIEKKKTFISRMWSLKKRQPNTNTWKNIVYVEKTFGQLKKTSKNFKAANVLEFSSRI